MCDVRTLIQWLSHDILALAGPVRATRQALFDFIVEELGAREPQDTRRLRPVRVALCSRRTKSKDRSPCELMMDQEHPHWLTLLGLGPIQPQQTCFNGGQRLPLTSHF